MKYDGLMVEDKDALLKEKENGGKYLVFNKRGFLVVNIDDALEQIKKMESEV